jgi:hypothetical protein
MTRTPNMKQTQPIRTGVFAKLSGLLRHWGSSAPTVREGEGRHPASAARRLVLPLAAALGFFLLSAASASAAVPTLTIDAPSSVTSASAQVKGSVNPGGFETKWNFTCSPSCSAPAAATLPPDEQSHPVSAQITGLAAGTTYTVVLHASNSAGESTAQTTFVTPAAGGLPWWHLESGSRPSYIDPGSGKPEVPGEPEVQELTFTLAGGENGTFINLCTEATPPVCKELGLFAYPEELADALEETRFLNAANLKGALEGSYGAGKVTVTESLEGETLTFKVSTPPVTNPISVESAGIGTAEAKILAHGTAGTPAVPDGEIYVYAENLGNANIDGSVVPVKLKDLLPPGLEAVGIAANQPNIEADFQHRRPLTCVPATLTCELTESLVPFDALEMRIAVNVVGPVTAANEVRISGGGAAAATLQQPLTISGQPVPFGVREYSMALEEEGGAPTSQAAAHPFQFTTQIGLNQGRDVNSVNEAAGGVGLAPKPQVIPVGLAKDVDFNLPPGLIGNPSKLTKCTTAEFFLISPVNTSENACPVSSAVGVTDVTVAEPVFAGTATIPEPIYNLEPAFGEPARFGFYVIPAGSPVLIDTAVRSGNGQDYGVTAETKNITQTAAFLSATATFWGVPGAHAHDAQRGYACLLTARGYAQAAPCLPNTEAKPPVLFSNPTSCTAPLQTNVDVQSWEDRTFRNYPGSFSPTGTLGGCNRVPFDPTIEAEPTSNAATSPTGLNFDINVTDPGLENPGGLVQSQIKKAVVSLPQGFTTNPSVAEGLKACSQAQYEAETVNSEAGENCPNESKIGNVEIESPLIEGKKVLGSLFVARQKQNPYDNLLTIYMVARNPELGVLIKQALRVTPNPLTGQLTTEVDMIPQLPFSHFGLSFRQGQRSPLVTPPTCGPYTVTADLYPYSEPNTPVHDESTFQITQGPEGQGCPNGTPPFHPGLEAGTVNNAAGTYSPFYTHITRKDSEQEITRFSIKLPPGLEGRLAGIPYCPNASIAAAKAREHEGGGTEEEQSPSCPKASEVGHTQVGTGVGNVLAYAPGKLYLAGPYKGADLSIVSITAAKVGPFDLGTVVIREGLKIDPTTAQVTVDAAGSDPIPHIVDGIPIHLRDIRIYVDKPNFTLNPTSCAKFSTSSTVLGSGSNFASEADDVPATVTSPFQAADCASLGFKPNLKLSYKGQTKRTGFPALSAVLTYPKGSYANIAKTSVTLPKGVFIANAHINNPCTRVQFNEEKCPANSILGHARAYSPLLEKPLEGPVYFRSNGGERELPDIVADLNGQIHIDLVGFIDSVGKKGAEVTRVRTRFQNVPDAPVSRFELNLFGGKRGLLENSRNLCGDRAPANLDLTGQNGKLYNTETKVPAPCGKAKKKGSKGKAKGSAGKRRVSTMVGTSHR